MSLAGCCVAQILASCSVCAGEDSAISLTRFLPPGEIEIEFLDAKPSTRGAALLASFQQGLAAAGNAWTQAYIRDNSRPGKPLPYHPNFGMTEAVYQEFLSELGKLQLEPVGDAWRCRIVWKSDIATFEPVGRPPNVLNTIRVHAPSTKAMADGEKLGAATWSHRPNADGAIGPWRGYQWELTPGDAESAALGQSSRLVTLKLLNPIGTDEVHVNQKTASTSGSREIMFRYRVPGLAEATD
ncbi:MAG: hypothetical protein AAF805_01780 [Planctomycetota bacterium]